MQNSFWFTARKIIADIVAMLVFVTVGSMILELLIVRLTLAQCLHARLTAIPVNLITARPYGMFRDWVFKFTQANQGSPAKKIIADILAFIFFQVPQYALILKFTGANPQQIITACGLAAGFSVFAGRPLGLCLEFSRWLFKVNN